MNIFYNVTEYTYTVGFHTKYVICCFSNSKLIKLANACASTHVTLAAKIILDAEKAVQTVKMPKFVIANKIRT